MSQELIENNAISVRARAEIDIQISTARAYPRNIGDFLTNSEEMVSRNEDIAASCIFSLPRKDKGKQIFIKGPSIRLAEILISCYGHFHAQVRVLEVTDKTVTVEGEAWDIQTGNRICLPHVENINGNFGDAKKLAIAIATSKALRNVTFVVIPRAYVDQIYAAACRAAVGDQKTLHTKVKTILSRFQQMGIDPEKILAYFAKEKAEDFNLEDVENLIGIGTAIKEGALNIDSAFTLDESTSSMAVEERVKHLLGSKDVENKE